MKRVYLIRHCLPEFPGGEKYCLGRTDFPLGPEGLLQAEQTARALPPVTMVFSSPLRRAVQTAQAIGEPVILEGLQELYAGDWDGLPFSEIRVRYPELYAARGITPGLPLPNGEPDAEGLARFQQALKTAAAPPSVSEHPFPKLSQAGVWADNCPDLGRGNLSSAGGLIVCVPCSTP